MRKNIFRLYITCLVISLSLVSPILAMDNNSFVLCTPDTDTSIPQLELELDQFNEFEYILAVRDAMSCGQVIPSISSQELEYINSDSVEDELLYRSTLPIEVLKDEYCYSDEEIQTLRKYDGGKLEDTPEIISIGATLSASIGELVKTEERVGFIYVWEWSSKPLCCFTDIVAVAWEGTYDNGLNNNVALDQQSSHAMVHYYANPYQEFQLSYDLTPSNLYGGASLDVAMSDKIENTGFWAKYGSIFTYVDLVNTSSGPDLYELAVVAKYGHSTLILSPSVSYPQALSISFSSGVEDLGERASRIRP